MRSLLTQPVWLRMLSVCYQHNLFGYDNLCVRYQHNLFGYECLSIYGNAYVVVTTA
ncbi:hypothetical protein LC607_14500 [Nostoc sp. CHAB 5824]|nr:hypothetical protein [Nostoc sp. CHAB 5824]